MATDERSTAPGETMAQVPAIDGAQCPLNFRGVEILAPMVRAGTLPLRSECLRYGADYVFGEEIIDRKIIGAIRVDNTAFGMASYISFKERSCVFSARASEKSRTIFQLGTANAALAAEAALTVCQDVRGIDINMGCPKSFSIKGGMGAALLEKPEIAADILKTVRRNLPEKCSLTCKIRMLENTEKTRQFMQVCERAGAEAITVHMRTRNERPAEPAHWSEIVKLWDAVKVPVVANGDFFTRRQIDEFWKYVGGAVADFDVGEDGKRGVVGPAGIMIARGALWNPSIFCRHTEPPSFEEVIRSYTKASVLANSCYQNTKWMLNQMFAGGISVTAPSSFGGVAMKAFNREVGAAKTMSSLCSLVGVDYQKDDWPAQAHMTTFYRDGAGASYLTKNPLLNQQNPEIEAQDPADTKRSRPRQDPEVTETESVGADITNKRAKLVS